MRPRLVSWMIRTPFGAMLKQQLRAAAAQAVTDRLTAIDSAASFPLSHWWEKSFWEPTVGLAIRDHCRPGDVVFDVGANAGAMALMMSRLVGPRGIVCAFEASPRIIDKTHYNLVQAGCHNVTLFHKAVWHATGERVNIAVGSHLVDDRVADSPTGLAVDTIALDDLSAAGDLRPSFIKMDIEGAEFSALQGMTRLLRDVRPVMVLEQAPDDMRCHALLTEAGYVALDLATYLPIRSTDDFRAGTVVANVLFAPREAAPASPYFSGPPPETVMTIAGDAFERTASGDVVLPDPPMLPAGRYVVRAEFTAEGSDNETYSGVEADGEMIFRYHTHTAFLAKSYRDWPIQLDRPARVAPFLRFLRGQDKSLVWNGVTIQRVAAFDRWPAPVIV